MHVHWVFVTKYRRGVFTKEVLEFNGEDDPVHLLITYLPKFSLSKRAHSLQGVSRRMIRKESFPYITKNLWEGHLWSPSYFSGSCGGATIDIIKQYIHQQRRRH